MPRPLLRITVALFSVYALCAPAVAPPAWAAVSEDQARHAIEQQFGVRVLKVVKSTFDGKPVYFLTVMSPGGNSNSAFQVNTLAVDPETGKLVSGFRHLSSGLRDAEGAGSRDANRQPDDALSQGRVWR